MLFLLRKSKSKPVHSIAKLLMALLMTVILIITPFNYSKAETDTLGPLTPHDTVYQIITDRFVDGNPGNNIPSGFDPGLFDGTGNDLKLFQGGDWDGIIEKIPYLKNLGITAVWISAPYENRDTAIIDYGTPTNVWTSFHGYHVRNYFAANPHFGDMLKFDELAEALHDEGIKLIIDFVTNHTSRWQNPTAGLAPEDGRLYEPDKDAYGNYVFDSNGNPVDYNGDGLIENLLADPHNDINGWFHGLGDRGDDGSRFAYRHKDLGSLADFSHENGVVVDYLEKAVKFWKAKGIDGLRHDATLHMSPAFTKGLKDAVDSDAAGPISHFGEFFIGRPDSKYGEYASFPERTGVNNLDFEFYRSITSTFGDFSRTMSDFANMLIYTSNDYIYENQTITFLDNHDVTRFRYIQPNDKPYHAAIAALMTCRGTPNIYYGTEQYLSPVDSSDIAGRMFMEKETTFNQNTTAFRLINKLSGLRQENDALAYGLTEILYSDDNVIVFKRQFYDKQVIVAINRQPDLSFNVPALDTTLPVGTYNDYLDGLLYGQSISVTNAGGRNKISAFNLSGGEVCVWSYNPSLGTTVPRIGDMVSTMGRAGNKVYIYGTGLGGMVTVKFGNTTATVLSNSDTKITAIVPNALPGVCNVTVVKGGHTSNAFRYEILSDDQNQVIFHVNATTYWGQNIYVVGSIPELGNWDPNKATEAMLCPDYPEWFLPVSVPKNTTFEFKFIKKDENNNVIWESGSNRVFSSPSGSTETVDTPLYYWK